MSREKRKSETVIIQLFGTLLEVEKKSRISHFQHQLQFQSIRNEMFKMKWEKKMTKINLLSSKWLVRVPAININENKWEKKSVNWPLRRFLFSNFNNCAPNASSTFCIFREKKSFFFLFSSGFIMKFTVCFKIHSKVS